jgi:2-iminobutanoate/2-iminopropanoate deaminase
MKNKGIVLVALLLICGIWAMTQAPKQAATADKSAVIVHRTSAGKFIQVGNTFYSAGIAARLPDGTVPEGMGPQTRVTLEKFQKAYEELGLKMSDVVKVNVYITDIKQKDQMNAEYSKVFRGDSAPCRTAVAVTALDPGRVVEMEMIAVKQ